MLPEIYVLVDYPSLDLHVSQECVDVFVGFATLRPLLVFLDAAVDAKLHTTRCIEAPCAVEREIFVFGVRCLGAQKHETVPRVKYVSADLIFSKILQRARFHFEISLVHEVIAF